MLEQIWLVHPATRMVNGQERLGICRKTRGKKYTSLARPLFPRAFRLSSCAFTPVGVYSGRIEPRHLLKSAGVTAFAIRVASLARADPPQMKGQEFNMGITRVGTQASSKGPADWFTGTVRIDPLFQAQAPARAAGASVTFEPRARTAWHTHPLGQTLIVTAGCGRVQRWGGPVEEIRPGDVVWFPPGEKHWHGAAPTTAMTHIAVQEQLDGKMVEWLEHVTDEQYGK
jgi:quercetin dioxygenase-like cupin family protein